MATRGFEFAYSLDRNSNTPIIRDFILGVSAVHAVGDAMVIQADGFIDAAAGSVGEVTCIMQEAFTAAQVTAGTTRGKAAIVTRNQVWRCSTDAATAATALVGTIKRWDLVDENTIDADDVSNGSLIVAQGEPAPEDLSPTDTTNKLDDDGNVIGYVVFADTTFGNT